MTDIESIFLTSCLTIVGGILIYVAGQFLSKVFIEPANELKKVIGEVRFNLAFHAAAILTPMSRSPERSEKASEALLKSSCDLLARVDAIPSYRALSRCSQGYLPSKEAIKQAAEDLRGLSTYVFDDVEKDTNNYVEIRKKISRVERNLNLEPLT